MNEFWKWFSACHKDFGVNFENGDLLSELDSRIVELGNFAWELGPGIEMENMLVVSPGGRNELLPQTKEIISNSPSIPNWEFHYAKPPKQWKEPIVNLYKGGRKKRIIASSWQYVLLDYSDGLFDIIIEAPNLADFCKDDKLIAAEIILEGLLGEEKRLVTIAQVDVVSEFEAQYKEGTNIKFLGQHIGQLTDK
ncbi:hypothetical protein DDR33_07225 [Pararcticibacter amylolyticus]|uniref:DUF695 domain-containing protein n=1 Tax=Pararcticibacter amylolyticus TaxID=2173175 RepID=A0A2U2PIS8_9SPHI|nr:hypothetical protein DDR33_07225 [Pararcticibacter amylolyticus]